MIIEQMTKDEILKMKNDIFAEIKAEQATILKEINQFEKIGLTLETH